MEESQLKNDLFQKENETFAKYHALVKEEEETWRLKSRSVWLQEGDRNIKFFHKHSKNKELRNKIHKINIGENLVEYFQQTKEEEVCHIQALYSQI